MFIEWNLPLVDAPWICRRERPVFRFLKYNQ